MSKIGYLLAALLIAGLGIYTLWPTPIKETVKLLPAAQPPAAWTARVPGGEQQVTPQQVTFTVDGKPYRFAPDSERVGQLWNTLAMIEVPAAKALSDVGESQLAGYGLDGRREASAADGSVLVRWGSSGDQAYVWNGRERRLLAVAPALTKQLDQLVATNVGNPQVLALQTPPKRLVVDGLALVREDSGWWAEMFRNRPRFDGRVASLLQLLAQAAIVDLRGRPVFGLPVVGTLLIPSLDAVGASSSLGTGSLPMRTVTIYDAGSTGVLAIDGYPAQNLDRAQLDGLRQSFAAFRRDVLVDLLESIPREIMLRAEIDRDGVPWWSLHRRDKPPAIGGFTWDVVWDGGRESGPDDAIERLARAVAQAPVRDPQPDKHALERLPAGAVTVTVRSNRPGTAPLRFAIAGGELRSQTHRARLADDGELLATMQPARFLDDHLIRRDPSRVAKIQRRFRNDSPPREEVVSRSEGGSWIRTYPAPAVGASMPVDGAAIDRLVRVLAAARMQEVGIIALTERGDGSRALLDQPEFELDVRFAAVAAGKASNDETDLDLSAAQDWGIALTRRDDGQWSGVDKDFSLRFILDADTVEELRRPFTPGQVYPVVASAVTAVSIARQDGAAITLVRNGQGWTVAADGAAPQPADAVAVRRWFRAIGALQMPEGTVLDDRVPEPNANETVATITCSAASIAGDPDLPYESLTLAVLAPTAQGQPVHVWSNRGGSRFPRGRALLPPSAVAEVLVDAREFAK